MNQNEEDKIEVEPIADEDARLSDPANKINKLKSELERSEKERKEYLDGWQRAKADFINYKKDEAKRFEEFAQFANAAVIQDLLPVLDSLELALANMPKENEKGIILIRGQLKDVLQKQGLEEIVVKPGDAFRPDEHESLGEEESGQPAGAVSQVLQKGYRLRGRVLRPARVKLSKNQ